MAVLAIVCVAPAPPAATMHWGLALGPMVGLQELIPGMSQYWHLMSAIGMLEAG